MQSNDAVAGGNTHALRLGLRLDTVQSKQSKEARGRYSGILERLTMPMLVLVIQVGPKNDTTCFCQNFVRSPQNSIIFGSQIV